MARILKTVEIPYLSRQHTLATNTTIASAATHSFGPLTVYIPETSGRVFKNCSLELTFRDNFTAATNVTVIRNLTTVGATSGANTDFTSTQTNSGDHTRMRFLFDLTPQFQTGFTGLTHNINSVVSFQTAANSSVNSISGKVFITYEYESNTNPTKLKTVRIPFESAKVTGPYPMSLTTIAVLPALTGNAGICKESGITFDHIWVEFYGNENQVSSTLTANYGLNYAIDAEGSSAQAVLNQGLNTSVWYYDIWKRSDINAGITHNLNISSSLTGFNCITPILYATYRYDSTQSTQTTNSLVIPISKSGIIKDSAAGGLDYFTKILKITEPNPQLLQSSIFFYQNCPVDLDLVVKAGIGATTTYKFGTSLAPNAGNSFISHRLDGAPGTSGGTAFTLTQGDNSLSFFNQCSSANLSNIQALLFLNYSSSVYNSACDDYHNKTIFWTIFPSQNGAGSIRSPGAIHITGPSLSTTGPGYFINSLGYIVGCNSAGGADILLSLKCHNTTEGLSGEWYVLDEVNCRSDAELSLYTSIYDVTRQSNYSTQKIFKRWSNDNTSTTLWDINNQKQYIFENQFGIRSFHTQMLFTYNNMVWKAQGSLTGYSGDGGGILVTLYALTGPHTRATEPLSTFTTITGGTFGISWFDNKELLFCDAYQDSTHIGRSVYSRATITGSI